MKYGDKLLKMEGVIVEVHDGSIAVDLKGRLGYLRVPLRMVISDYDLKVGQTVSWKMSFIEQDGPEINEHYMSNIEYQKKRKEELNKRNYNEED
ncbi:MAG: hypothetical protein IJH91_06805 [Mogibacterium sp.]|nr:hypothetical protein [Mogibacterium sp.]